MAYNFFPSYQYPYQQQAYQQQPLYQPQTQGSSFVSVRNIEEAYNYPVAPGNSITFKDENSPFVYTKTKGFSPLEQPVFEKYRLVKVEETPQDAPEGVKSAPSYDDQIKSLWDEVNALKRRIKEAGNEPANDEAV